MSDEPIRLPQQSSYPMEKTPVGLFDCMHGGRSDLISAMGRNGIAAITKPMRKYETGASADNKIARADKVYDGD